jgi:hypothetical protein
MNETFAISSLAEPRPKSSTTTRAERPRACRSELGPVDVGLRAHGNGDRDLTVDLLATSHGHERFHAIMQTPMK